MTTDERFGRELSAWLDEDARGRVPAHLGEVLVQTVATRQRPWWASAERWLPMTTTTFTGRVAGPRLMVLLAIAALVAATVASLVFLAGTRHPTVTPFGLNPNGRILVADGATIRSFAADGTDGRDVADVRGGTETLALSPDATRVAYRVATQPASIEVRSLADGSTATITIDATTDVPERQVSWSPDGSQLAFVGSEGAGDELFLAKADGSAAPVAVREALSVDGDLWAPAFSPDGRWISYVTVASGGFDGQLHVIRPDGSAERVIDDTAGIRGWGAPSWSPDRTVERLLFPTTHTGVAVVDVTTGERHAIPDSYWPSWSPDGSHLSWYANGTFVAPTSFVLAGTGEPVEVFPPANGDCSPTDIVDSGKLICSPAVFSPDGTKVMGVDPSGRMLLIVGADATGTPVKVPMEVTALNAGLTWAPAR